jgi:GNAT superfamily N-acetyltransferase
LLVAELDEEALGYISLVENPAPASGWATDLVVGLRHRRQGVATRLLAAACQWCRGRGMSQLFLEMQSKNIPAIRLATKIGSVFSGYSDRYYPNQDIALFFALSLR